MTTLLLSVLFGVLVGYFRYRRARRRHPDRFAQGGKQIARNLPQVFLYLAFLSGMFSFWLLVSWLNMPKEGDLKSVAGSVQRAPRFLVDGLIAVPVELDGGLHDDLIYDDNLSHSREIMKLKPGDHITARVHSFLGDTRIWELKRDGITIISYQETYQYEYPSHERLTTNLLAFGTLSAILLTVALALRIHFGAWRNPTGSLPAMQGSSEVGAWQGSTPASATPDNSEFAGWQGPTPSASAIQNGSEDADTGQTRWSTKKKCPECGSSCYIFDRQCHHCQAQLQPAPARYRGAMECLFLLAFAIAYIAARRLGIDTFWIIGFVLALKFIVEGILRNSARRATDTAGV